MNNSSRLESQVRNLLKESSESTLTMDDFFINTVFALEKVIASMIQIKDAIRKRKGKITINELLIIGAKFELLSMEIQEIRREHHL